MLANWEGNRRGGTRPDVDMDDKPDVGSARDGAGRHRGHEGEDGLSLSFRYLRVITLTQQQPNPTTITNNRRSLAPGIEQKMVQEALHRDTFNKGNKQGFNGEDTQKYKRVAIAVVEPFVIDTRR